MGRHASAAPVDAVPEVAPRTGEITVTDPRLLDRPTTSALPLGTQVPPTSMTPERVAAPRLIAPRTAAPRPAATVPARPVAATPRVAEAIATMHPRPFAPSTVRDVQREAVLLPPTLTAPGMLVMPHPTAPVPAMRAVNAALSTGPIDIIATEPDEEPTGFSRSKRGVKLAVCAVALLGAVSGAAVLVPNDAGSANAATTGKAPAGVSSAIGYACSPTTLARRLRTHPHARSAHRVAPHGFLASVLAALAGGDSSSALPSTNPSVQPTTSSTASTTSSPTASASGSTSASATPSSSASATATPSASSSPTATTTKPTQQPSESAPTKTETPTVTGGGDLRSLIQSNIGSLALGVGRFVFSNFMPLANSDNLLGVAARGSLVGSGMDTTILQMKAGTSTRAGNVPTRSGTTNQLSLVRIDNAKTVRDFSLVGTQQGHLYNGLRIAQSNGAKVSNVRVTSVPGNDDNPPGETFGINDSNTDGSVYSNVEVDGAGVGGANFGTNSSNDVTVENSYFHDSGHSHGATFWQTKNVTVRNTVSNNNYDTGFNFERVSGVVTLTNTTTKGDRLADIRIGSDKGSAVYNIVNPVYSGSKLRIMLTPTYFGVTNLQRRSDIHVIINGKDRTNDVVEWVTHF